MILVLYAYGGWNDAAFVAAELRKRRNIALALILGTTAVTLIYLVVNLAYVSGLGFEGVRQSQAVAADILKQAWPSGGNQAMCVLVMVSALGAINGLIFAGSRVYAALGRDNPVFAQLGRWHPTLGAPIGSLAAQALVTLLMIAAVGTQTGRLAIDQILTGSRTDTVEWDRLGGGFGALLAVTAPPFWAFFLLSGVSLFVLRQRDPDVDRPFKVRFFPELPMVFCALCVYMLYQSVVWAGKLTIFVAVLVLLGVPLYRLSERLRTGRWSTN
jgi:amino acid transporter